MSGISAASQSSPIRWLYYFNVADIEAATGRVEAGGGKIFYGPMEVPGGAG
jgi:uncharacterized protein